MGTREVVEGWYGALAAADLEAFAALHHEDVAYNIVGRTDISGRWEGRAVMFEQVIPKVFAALDPEALDFANPWRIFAVEDTRAAGLMRGGGRTTDGDEYEQSYVHLFEVNGGLITEVWEFFDTALAQVRLFGGGEVGPMPDNRMSY